MAKVLDDVTAIKETISGLGAAKILSALNDVGITLQVGLGNTAQSATTVVTAGNTATSLAVGSSASVLLQAGVGDTAFAAGYRSATILAILAGDQDSAARGVANTLSVDDAGGGNGSEAENNGGDGELHFGWLKKGFCVCFLGD